MWFISLIQGFVTAIGNLFKSLFSLKSSVGRPSSNATRWIVRIALVLFVLTVCVILSLQSVQNFIADKIGFDFNDFTSRAEWLVQFGFDNETNRWLFFPLLWLLVCGIVWLIAALLRDPYAPVTSQFPDIDEAWFRGLDALARAGKDIRDLPLFIVTGLTDRATEGFFKTARIGNLAVSPDNAQPSALHFYAHREVTSSGEQREALFIVLTEACATSLQVEKLPSATMASPAAPNLEMTMRNVNFHNDHNRTLGPESIGQMLNNPPPTERVVPLHERELSLCGARLAHVCDLLRTFRTPWCPINGTLLVLPLDWTTSQEKQDLLKTPRQDLALLHRELEMVFPISLVFTGLEQLPGFSEFLARGKSVNPILPHSNAGSRFPPGHEINDKLMSRLVNRAMDWFQGWVYASFLAQMEAPGNQQLYRFLCQLDERRVRIIRMLTLTFRDLGIQQPARLIGVYFASAAGPLETRGFLSSVMGRLISAENEVAYTADAINRDHRNLRLAFFCFWLAGVLLFVEVLWIILLWLDAI